MTAAASSGTSKRPRIDDLTMSDFHLIALQKRGAVTVFDEFAASELLRAIRVASTYGPLFDLAFAYKRPKVAAAKKAASPLQITRKRLSVLRAGDLDTVGEILRAVEQGCSLDDAMKARVRKMQPEAPAAEFRNARADALEGHAAVEAERAKTDAALEGLRQEFQEAENRRAQVELAAQRRQQDAQQYLQIATDQVGQTRAVLRERARALVSTVRTIKSRLESSGAALTQEKLRSQAAQTASQVETAALTTALQRTRRRALAVVSVAKHHRSRLVEADRAQRRDRLIVYRHRLHISELRRRLKKSRLEVKRFSVFFAEQMDLARQFKAQRDREKNRADWADLNSQQMRAQLDRCTCGQGTGFNNAPKTGIKAWIRSGLRRH